MMETKLYNDDIPSNRIDLLKVLTNLTLTKLVRYSWWDGEKTTRELGISANRVFSYCGGPVLCYFNTGLVIGAFSDSSKASIIVWVERNERGQVCEEPIEDDEEYVPIYAADNMYSDDTWKQILGQKISNVQILKREPKNSKYLELKNEVGILITMENKMKFVLSHGLHDDSGDFSIILEEHINSNILGKLQMLDINDENKKFM